MSARPTLIFDFDSTLVDFETLEVLADIALAGTPDAETIRAQIAALTDQAMGGEIAFGEALQPGFKTYAQNVVDNARALAESLKSNGLDIVSGGTDNHLMLVDLRPKNATGKRAETALGRANITCNKNGIPFDPEKPFVTSGVRLGSPAGTTRGFGKAEFTEIGNLISEVLDGLKAANSDEGNASVEAAVKAKVIELTGRFPIYADM